MLLLWQAKIAALAAEKTKLKQDLLKNHGVFAAQCIVLCCKLAPPTLVLVCLPEATGRSKM